MCVKNICAMYKYRKILFVIFNGGLSIMQLNVHGFLSNITRLKILYNSHTHFH